MQYDTIVTRILNEDNHLIVFNKQSSEITQGDKTGDTPLTDLISGYIRNKYNKPGNAFIGLVHRLDRPVSGAVLFARTSKSLTRLTGMLKNGGIRKTYWAIVKNPPPDQHGHLVSYLTRNEKQNKTYVHSQRTGDAKKAELIYTVKGESERYWLLEINLLTGRHHQIRAQLSSIGCPVRGDLKYGYPRSNPGGSIHLHSRNVCFIHPVKNELINVTAPLPEDPVWKLFSGL